MKTSYYVALSLIALFFIQCTSESKTTLKPGLSGNLDGGQDLQLFVEKSLLNNNYFAIDKTTIGLDGSFSLELGEVNEPMLIRLRVGTHKTFLPLAAGDNSIKITGNVTDLSAYTFQIEGSEDSQKLVELMQKATNRELKLEDVQKVVENTDNPVLGIALLMYSAPPSKQTLPLYKSISLKMAEETPNSEYREPFARLVASMESKMAVVEVGELAPDLSATSPDGKTYKLSDLKGKVVLLDFWASWCRPCRAENPNVVKVYEKYKDKGFTVFSVSLDQSKDRWVNAIKQDKLTWEYHISDLKGWQSQPASVYKVRSIPAAYIIDKDGVIAKTNVRGAHQIEDAIKDLL